jgi:hypothetical protein
MLSSYYSKYLQAIQVPSDVAAQIEQAVFPPLHTQDKEL